MDELIIVQNGGVLLAEIDEGKYLIRHTPDFAAAAPKNGQEDTREDTRVETLCSVASALFLEISKIERLKKLYGVVHDIYDFGLPDVLPVLIVNAVMHGNKCDPSKTVSVSYTHVEPNVKALHGTFSTTVSDQGHGFNYRALREAERNARATSRSFNHYRSPEETPANSIGLGLFSVLGYATRVRWNDTGNEITITKRLRLQSVT